MGLFLKGKTRQEVISLSPEENSNVQMEIIDISRNLSLSTVNDGKCLFQYRDEDLTIKILCVIVAQFNNSLNVTTSKMAGGDIYECAIILSEHTHDRVEDFIMCLKNAKKGAYGKVYNRVDTQVILEFWRSYLEEKAHFLENTYLSNKSKEEHTRNETDTLLIQSQRKRESFEQQLYRQQAASRMEISSLKKVIDENRNK